jgi:hypothetical protein
MAQKKITTRIQNKHDVEANWIVAGNNGFIPLAGELIIYDKDDSHDYRRFKFGDGVIGTDGNVTGTNITDLPFVGTSWNDLTDKPSIEDGVDGFSIYSSTEDCLHLAYGQYKISALSIPSGHTLKVGDLILFKNKEIAQCIGPINETNGTYGASSSHMSIAGADGERGNGIYLVHFSFSSPTPETTVINNSDLGSIASEIAVDDLILTNKGLLFKVTSYLSGIGWEVAYQYSIIGANGKSAYEYAQDSGYTGTEEEFATKLAAAIPAKLSELENDTGYVTENDVKNTVNEVIDAAPEALNTLNELAQALGDDPNFATTVATNIGKKVDKTTTINSKALSSNITLTASDVSALSDKVYPAIIADGAIKITTNNEVDANTAAGKTIRIYFNTTPTGDITAYQTVVIDGQACGYALSDNNGARITSANSFVRSTVYELVMSCDGGNNWTITNYTDRLVAKHYTGQVWRDNYADYVPDVGEIIVYDSDPPFNCPRFKIGDGIFPVAELPFITNRNNVSFVSEDSYILTKRGARKYSLAAEGWYDGDFVSDLTNGKIVVKSKKSWGTTAILQCVPVTYENGFILFYEQNPTTLELITPVAFWATEPGDYTVDSDTIHVGEYGIGVLISLYAVSDGGEIWTEPTDPAYFDYASWSDGFDYVDSRAYKRIGDNSLLGSFMNAGATVVYLDGGTEALDGCVNDESGLCIATIGSYRSYAVMFSVNSAGTYTYSTKAAENIITTPRAGTYIYVGEDPTVGPRAIYDVVISSNESPALPDTSEYQDGNIYAPLTIDGVEYKNGLLLWSDDNDISSADGNLRCIYKKERIFMYDTLDASNDDNYYESDRGSCGWWDKDGYPTVVYAFTEGTHLFNPGQGIASPSHNITATFETPGVYVMNCIPDYAVDRLVYHEPIPDTSELEEKVEAIDEKLNNIVPIHDLTYFELPDVNINGELVQTISDESVWVRDDLLNGNIEAEFNLTDGKLSQKYCATVSKAATKQAISYIEVYSQEDLMNMSGQSAGYQLMNDIDLDENFESIPNFGGSLDGNGYAIRGLTKPLFAYFDEHSNVYITNLELYGAIDGDQPCAYGSYSDDSAGALVAYCMSDMIGQGSVTLNNVVSHVTITSATNAGGLIGTVQGFNVNIENCFNYGYVHGYANAGGFIGKIRAATVNIQNSVNEGEVYRENTSGVNVGGGGFIGYGATYSSIPMNLNVARCINKGYIHTPGTASGQNGDGGIGGIFGSTGWADNTKENISITECANYGEVKITGSNRGRSAGIAGRISKGAAQVMIEYCYNLGTITGGIDTASGVLGYTAAPTTLRCCYNAGELIGNRYPVGGHSGAKTCTQEYNYFYTPDETYSTAGGVIDATITGSITDLNNKLLNIPNTKYKVIEGRHKVQSYTGVYVPLALLDFEETPLIPDIGATGIVECHFQNKLYSIVIKATSNAVYTFVMPTVQQELYYELGRIETHDSTLEAHDTHLGENDKKLFAISQIFNLGTVQPSGKGLQVEIAGIVGDLTYNGVVAYYGTNYYEYYFKFSPTDEYLDAAAVINYATDFDIAIESSVLPYEIFPENPVYCDGNGNIYVRFYSDASSIGQPYGYICKITCTKFKFI